MRQNRWWLIACVFLVLVALPGCGGCAARERDKNSDLDRPKSGLGAKPAEKK